ncbi:MAG: hypothetical protein ACXW0T_12220 [Methylobacter sp.]
MIFLISKERKARATSRRLDVSLRSLFPKSPALHPHANGGSMTQRLGMTEKVIQSAWQGVPKREVSRERHRQTVDRYNPTSSSEVKTGRRESINRPF